jgi:hypothetical protein
MTIGGVQLERRAAVQIGTLRAVSALKDQFGLDILGGSIDEGAIYDLLLKPGGPQALLSVLFTGPVQEVDEDRLSVEDLLGALGNFFGSSGRPSTGQPAGSPEPTPDPSGPPAES